MKKIFLSVLIICYGIASVAGQTVKIDSLTVARFGKVHIYTTGSGSPQNLIIMISGDGGWKYGVHEFAKEFSKMNSIVALWIFSGIMNICENRMKIVIWFLLILWNLRRTLSVNTISPISYLL